MSLYLNTILTDMQCIAGPKLVTLSCKQGNRGIMAREAEPKYGEL